MKIAIKSIAFIVCVLFLINIFAVCVSAENSYIKWVDFSVCQSALSDAVKIDTESYGTEKHCSAVTLLAIFAAKNGGNFSGYKSSALSDIKGRLDSGENALDIAKNEKLYNYYTEAYSAALGGMMGTYRVSDYSGNMSEEKYGMRLFSPIASGYYYNHYDDFGASRSYGYKRRHLGHDLMGSVGTPIVAIESGYVEACGWNQYGGWRVGIRSFDGKRYYYYAHLRKGHPYNDMYEGKIVNAGEVIGYLGYTGYSAKENVNNIDTPHLHYGLELIFDLSQKDGYNQIWIDVYALTNFLSKYRSQVALSEDGKEKNAKLYYIYSEAPD